MIGAHQLVHLYSHLYVVYVTSVRYNSAGRKYRFQLPAKRLPCVLIKNSKIHRSAQSLWSLIFSLSHTQTQTLFPEILIFLSSGNRRRSQLNWFISYRIDLHTVQLGSLEIQSALTPASLSTSRRHQLLRQRHRNRCLLPCMNKLNFSQSVSVKPTSFRAERTNQFSLRHKNVFLQ